MADNQLSVIDSHVHFWSLDRLDYDWLAPAGPDYNRTHSPQEFLESSAHGDVVVSQVVFVQADPRPHLNVEEAVWVHELAESGVPIMAVVAGAALERGRESRAELDQLLRLPLVTGIRRLLQDEPLGFALEPGFVKGVQLLSEYEFSMDLCIRQHHLPDAFELVAHCPEVTFILDHFGKPQISADAFPGWADGMSRLAGLPNVVCKLSGLTTETTSENHNAQSLAPWFSHALEAFGPERCMFGSDWPLVDKASNYASWIDIVIEMLADFSDAERDAVLWGTAKATYHPLNRMARLKES